MARKRAELGAESETRIAVGIHRGETAEQIAAALGGSVSSRTIGRRMREIRGPVQSPRPGAKSPAAEVVYSPPPRDRESRPDVAGNLPASPDEIPEGASLPELLSLLERCKSALASAEADKNLPLVGQMIRVAASLSETIRKATPPKQVDPNDAPDMVALRVEAARKWHEMIDLVADG